MKNLVHKLPTKHKHCDKQIIHSRKLVDPLQNIVKIDSLNVAEKDPSVFTHYLDTNILDKGHYIAFYVQVGGCTIKVQLETDK